MSMAVVVKISKTRRISRIRTCDIGSDPSESHTFDNGIRDVQTRTDNEHFVEDLVVT